MLEDVRAFIAMLEEIDPDELTFEDRWKLYELLVYLIALVDQQGEG